MEVFDFLTISATIDNKIFAVHGGSTRTHHRTRTTFA